MIAMYRVSSIILVVMLAILAPAQPIGPRRFTSIIASDKVMLGTQRAAVVATISALAEGTEHSGLVEDDTWRLRVFRGSDLLIKEADCAQDIHLTLKSMPDTEQALETQFAGWGDWIRGRDSSRVTPAIQHEVAVMNPNGNNRIIFFPPPDETLQEADVESAAKVASSVSMFCVDTSKQVTAENQRRLEKLCGSRLYHILPGRLIPNRLFGDLNRRPPLPVLLNVELANPNPAFSELDRIPLRVSISNSPHNQDLPAGSILIVSDFAIVEQQPHFLHANGVVAAALRRGQTSPAVTVDVEPRPGSSADSLPTALLLELRTPDRKTVLAKHKFELKTNWFASMLRPKDYPFSTVNSILTGEKGAGKSTCSNAGMSCVSNDTSVQQVYVTGYSGDTKSLTVNLTRFCLPIGGGSEMCWTDTEGLGTPGQYGREATGYFLSGAVPIGHHGADLESIRAAVKEDAERRAKLKAERTPWQRMNEPAPRPCQQHEDAAHAVVFVVHYGQVSCVAENNNPACQERLATLKQMMDIVRADYQRGPIVALTFLNNVVRSERNSWLDRAAKALGVDRQHVFEAPYHDGKPVRSNDADWKAFRLNLAISRAAAAFAKLHCPNEKKRDAEIAADHAAGIRAAQSDFVRLTVLPAALAVAAVVAAVLAGMCLQKRNVAARAAVRAAVVAEAPAAPEAAVVVAVAAPGGPAAAVMAPAAAAAPVRVEQAPAAAVDAVVDTPLAEADAEPAALPVLPARAGVAAVAAAFGAGGVMAAAAAAAAPDPGDGKRAPAEIAAAAVAVPLQAPAAIAQQAPAPAAAPAVAAPAVQDAAAAGDARAGVIPQAPAEGQPVAGAAAAGPVARAQTDGAAA